MAILDLPELFILRHAETDWNAEGRMQGRFDSDLTARGRLQAQAMGQMLRAAGVGPDTHQWLSSPQGRAVETARLARLATGDQSPVTLDARLAEIGMGAWAGLSRDEIAAGWPGPEGEDMIAFYARIPDGESFAALEARVTAFLADCTKPAIIITHGMTSRFLRMAALGLARSDLLGLPGGQGVVHHLRDGAARLIGLNQIPVPAADGLHARGTGCMPPV